MYYQYKTWIAKLQIKTYDMNWRECTVLWLKAHSIWIKQQATCMKRLIKLQQAEIQMRSSSQKAWLTTRVNQRRVPTSHRGMTWTRYTMYRPMWEWPTRLPHSKTSTEWNRHNSDPPVIWPMPSIKAGFCRTAKTRHWDIARIRMRVMRTPSLSTGSSQKENHRSRAPITCI